MLKTFLGIARQWSRPSRLGVMERGLSEDSEVVRASHLPPNVAWIRISKATSPRALNSFSLFLVLILAERVHFLGSSVFPSTKELNWKIPSRSGTRVHAKTNQFFYNSEVFCGSTNYKTNYNTCSYCNPTQPQRYSCQCRVHLPSQWLKLLFHCNGSEIEIHTSTLKIIRPQLSCQYSIVQ